MKTVPIYVSNMLKHQKIVFNKLKSGGYIYSNIFGTIRHK